MLLTPANLSFFFTSLETRFWQAYGTAAPWTANVASEYPVGTEQWVSGWIGMLDKMRLWLGPRVTRTPGPQTYLVAIQPFELTVSVDKFKIEDDTYGIYFPIAERMGQQARKWSDYQLRDLIFALGAYTSTASQTGTDGVTHWNTAHPVDYWDAAKGTYPNDYRGGVTVDGVTVGGAFSANAFNSVWQDMASRPSESGEALGLVPDLTQVAPQLRAAAMTLLQSQLIAPPQLNGLGSGAVGTGNGPFVGAMSNPLYQATDLHVNPDFSSYPNTWFMYVTKEVIKPYSWLLRKAPDFVSRTQPTDPVVFDSHTFVFGSEARGAPAWSLPFLSSVSGPTAATFS